MYFTIQTYYLSFENHKIHTRMKNSIITIFLVACSAISFAQKKTDASIKGHVLNTSTGEHIPFIAIAIKGTTIGSYTDATGHYVLNNLPVGNYVVSATGVGYKPVEKTVTIEAGRCIEIDFDTEEDQIQLDGVVVSANRNEVRRKEASTIVNVMSAKMFETTNSVCLAQGLSFQPGLRVENNCQNCSYQQVRINGLEGPYSQILIDSRPVFSALAGVYGIEQIPTNMIERVEVMRGGGSALFGSNAIAGTINIITKEPTSNSATLANTTNLIGGKATDFNTSVNAAVVSDNRKTGLMVFGSSRQRSPFDYDGDGFTEIGTLDSKNIGFRSYYRLSDYSKITVEYHNMGEFRRGGNKLDLAPHDADIAEQTEHGINSGSAKYDIIAKNSKHLLSVYTSAQNIKRKSYYGAQRDLNAYGTTTDKTFVGGGQYTHKMESLLFMPADLTMGAEYSLNEMTDKMLGYGRTINQEVNTKSFFAQNEWKNKKLSVLIGGRIDQHNLIEKPIISPRLNLRYSPQEWVSMRASYSNGFRAPQAFDEDLHISAVGGEVTIIRIDPDLKTEKSQSISGSVDLVKEFGTVQANFLIEGFYTRLSNVFVLEEMGRDEEGNIVLLRKNGAGALVRGVNLEGKILPIKQIQLQFGMTIQKSEYEEDQQWSDNPNIAPHKKMFRSPERYGYLTVNNQLNKNLSLALSGTYTGSMLVQHFAGYATEDMEKTTPNFYDINLKLIYDFKLNNTARMQLNGGVQNILNSYQNDFDKGEFRDAGYIYGPSLPRTYFAGLKFMI